MITSPSAWTGHHSSRRGQGKSGCLMVLPVAAMALAVVLWLV